jgi:uncharacterized protein YjbI with pentapeptide repeats
MRIGGWRKLQNRMKARNDQGNHTASSGQNEILDDFNEFQAVPPELHDVSPEQLNKILDAHRTWLESDGKEGQRADLSESKLAHVDLPGINLSMANLQGADFSEANLAGANLQEVILAGANLGKANIRGADLRRALLSKANLKRADLSGANLEEASLGGANLQRACLAHTHFREANLHRARLWDADLRDTELTDAHDLLGAQLAGADVSGANLPPAVARFDALRQARESAEIARPMFVLMLIASLYAFATITSTTDAALLANFSSEFLPDVSVPIPTVWFFFAMPLLLFSLYVYLNLYIEQIWRGISDLPSVFPDGTLLHRVVYPWLLIRLLSRAVSGHSVVFAPDISATRAVINLVFIFVVWWLVPITLLFFGARYLPAHDWFGTSVHMVLLVLAIGSGGFGIYSFRPAQAMRRGDEYHVFSLKKPSRGMMTNRSALALGMGVIFAGLSYGSINGIPLQHANLSNVRTWVPYAMSFIGYSPFGDFRDADVSVRPESWRRGIGPIRLVKGAVLRDRDLRYLQASRAFLVNADLRNSDLYGAVLSEAHLEGADLRGANLESTDLTKAQLRLAKLQDASLRAANLRGADLTAANLARANLRNTVFDLANLSKAILVGAKLNHSHLRKTDLRGSNLSDADLQWAVLRGAQLQDADLRKANLQYSDLGGANLSEADLTKADLLQAEANSAVLSGANLTVAKLQDASLINAKLQGTRLRGASLQRAVLEKADLTEAVLRFAGLEEAVLRFAKLQEADFGAAKLHRADLVGVDAQGAAFRGAELQDAELGGAILEFADLKGANLSGANLMGAVGLTQEQLDDACGDDKTKLPDNLTVRPC